MRWDATTMRVLQEAAARSAEDTVMNPEFTSRLVDSISKSVTDNLVSHPGTEEYIRAEVEKAAKRISETFAPPALPAAQPSMGDLDNAIDVESDRMAGRICSKLGIFAAPIDLAGLSRTLQRWIFLATGVGVGAYVIVSVVKWLTSRKR